MADGIDQLPDLCQWHTSEEYQQQNLNLKVEKFFEVSNLLLENPNLNSSHLFRADILYDSRRLVKTTAEKEHSCLGHRCQERESPNGHLEDQDYSAQLQPSFSGIAPQRVVIRRLIPRNTNLDRPLDQTCLMYKISPTSHAVIYLPDIQHEQDIPWYHPPIKALAYLYEQSPLVAEADANHAELSLHFLLFAGSTEPPPARLRRTIISLLATFIRLSKHPSNSSSSSSTPPMLPSSTLSSSTPAVRSTAPSAIKDTIIPQHLVQNTYSRLKTTYASSLIARWVEFTEPSKHVFEDLSIAAFLIELWKLMYDCAEAFPGFIDIACGNGVLVYILIKEGWKGWGFDARRRKTWDVLDIDDFLREMICIPKPFLEVLDLSADDALPSVSVHDGMFPRRTFIISNHADELTPWTPLLAALSSPESPLPFLAIPCCSHALSGAKKRYTPKDISRTTSNTSANTSPNNHHSAGQTTIPEEAQPSTGDLKSLRTAKLAAAKHTDDKSMYACLTHKVVALAEEVGFADDGEVVEMTLMRIPSTRNIGVVGGRKRNSVLGSLMGVGKLGIGVEAGMEGLALRDGEELGNGEKGEIIATSLHAVVQRECASTGGIAASAQNWIDRAMKLQTGKGRGKVNKRYKPVHHVENGGKES
jgi:tRNASer (uridine44-2'-O)-methyltransferase